MSENEVLYFYVFGFFSTALILCVKTLENRYHSDLQNLL